MPLRWKQLSWDHKLMPSSSDTKNFLAALGFSSPGSCEVEDPWADLCWVWLSIPHSVAGGGGRRQERTVGASKPEELMGQETEGSRTWYVEAGLRGRRYQKKDISGRTRQTAVKERKAVFEAETKREKARAKMQSVGFRQRSARNCHFSQPKLLDWGSPVWCLDAKKQVSIVKWNLGHAAYPCFTITGD